MRPVASRFVGGTRRVSSSSVEKLFHPNPGRSDAMTRSLYTQAEGTMADAVRSVRSREPIVVHIPAEVTFDLAKFNKVIASLGERLGCGPCISGSDCHFSIIKDYLVDPASLRVNEITIGH
jgi:hypothetical protein